MTTKKNAPTKPKLPTSTQPGTVEVGTHEYPTVEDQKYFDMVWAKFEKSSRDQDPNQHDALFCIAMRSIPSLPELRTPHDAFKVMLAAGQTRLPIPPWAVRLLDKIVADRVDGRIQSLDSAFGFSSLGQGKGKRVSPIEAHLRSERNDRLCFQVLKLQISGEGVESACHKVVKELMCNPNWNETAYDLDLIKQKVKKQDPITREDEMAEALKAIYYRWKKRIGGPALKAFRDEYLKNPTQ